MQYDASFWQANKAQEKAAVPVAEVDGSGKFFQLLPVATRNQPPLGYMSELWRGSSRHVLNGCVLADEVQSPQIYSAVLRMPLRYLDHARLMGADGSSIGWSACGLTCITFMYNQPILFFFFLSWPREQALFTPPT